MNKDEAMKQVCNLFAAAALVPEKTYCFTLVNKQIVYYPRNELPKDAVSIFQFTHKMAKEGLSGKEWTQLETVIRKLIEGNMI